MTKEFSVCQFFADATCEYLGRYLSDEDAVQLAVQAARSVGARLGTTKRVIITDGGDSINWEWKHGKGVVYPPELAGQDVDSKDDATAVSTQNCPTCGEPYSRDPSPRAAICSNGFHCCRDCTWVAGRRVQLCVRHCADCARIAEEDGDILPPACERHGGRPPAKRGEGR
jgi:hypothetical protein